MGAAPSAQAGVEVFTASHIPVSNVPEQATVVELDALAGLDEVLGQGLPADPDQAQRVAEHRMRSAQWQSFAQRYEQAAMAAARAWVLGVEKIPAVVVDGHFVVYGQPDVAAALALIEQGRAAP
ncbi:TIGR03757 family integrating conjugative element protein [Azotobacter vinelandii]|uniref:TIGR03757 family integrating conjugative element protein n=1 Tax=Azotobacter vinelandii TaxID=354 RepID=UPI001E499B4B|nr:TIGR03757 family integrating conjugative element protein [Azotobacter vinelandii]